MKKNKEIIMIISLFIVSFILLIYNHTFVETKYYNDGLLYINEVMPSNKFTILDNDLEYSDYIELYNDYDYDINLSGYYLSDEDNFNTKWKFPEISIKAKGYLLIYASGKNKCNDGKCHTNFKLDSKTETITLTNSDYKVISKIKYKNSDSDTSYGYNDNKYVYYYVGTPNMKNKDNYSDEPIKREKSNIKIRINEYTNNNVSLLKDEDKEFYNILELYNYGDTDINMKDFFLTNKQKELEKYTFPDVTIKKNNYLTIYLSGKNKNDKQLHTNFTITNLDNTLILLSDKLEEIDSIEMKELPIDMTSFLYNDEWLYSFKQTFGYENNEENSTTNYVKNDNIKRLIINEVSSTGIEIKNISNEVINLKDYGLKGNGSSIKKLPDIKINPNSYLVIYESDTYSYKNNRINIGFKIGNDQEIITLYDNFNNVLDKFTVGKLKNDISYGLNNNEIVIFDKITLGSNNNTNYYKGYTKVVNFSVDGGYVDNNSSIELTTSDNGTIYYTIDGSFPTNKSLKYDKPIVITKTMTIKAVSYKENYLSSDCISRTFFVGRIHNLPIVSISTSNNDLNGSNGLFTKFKSELEKKISFEFYETDGTLGIMFNGGTKLVGQDSRNYPQKSMAVYLRSNYGIKEIDYPLFSNHDVTTFSSFTIRNSGEDVNYLKIKDIFLTEVLRGQMDLDFQYFRTVVVYINGKYYGIYNIREKINEDYLANNHGIDPDNVDLIKGNNDVRAGTYTNYQNLITYVKSHNLSNQTYYNYVKSQVDIQELINYWVVQTYYCNTDTGNIRFWREKTEGSKWRWVLFDQDWAMYPSTYRNLSRLTVPFEPNGHGAVIGSFSTSLTYHLWKNAEFRDQYLKTFAYHMKNTFNPERMIKVLDDIVNTVNEEMPYHVDRWYQDFVNDGLKPLTMNLWENNLSTMKTIIRNRYNIVLNNVKSKFKLSNAEFNKYFGNL